MASSIVPKADSIADKILIELSQFSVVASYNWLDEPQPTILVPGIPPIWSPPSDVPALKPDTGTRYIDQNADRMPSSPLEPLIRAIQAHRPDFDFSEVDVTTDRRSLRQLYGFVSGTRNPFEFAVEVVGNTMVFTRAETHSRETIAPNTFAGYRQSFEQAYTKLHPAAKGSTSHHRIITYTLGGMRLLVRSGTDAYRPSAAGELSTLQSSNRNSQEHFTKNVKTVSLNRATPSPSDPSATGKLQVIQGGYDVPQAAVLELSTHALAKPSVMEDKITDLYLAQTPCFVEATFRSTGPRYNLEAQRGFFDDIKMTHMTSWTDEWEMKHQVELKKLVNVLEQIMSEARTWDKPCIVRYAGGGDLRLQGMGDRELPTFPGKLKELFLKSRRSNTPEMQEQAEAPSEQKQKGKNATGHESLH